MMNFRFLRHLNKRLLFAAAFLLITWLASPAVPFQNPQPGSCFVYPAPATSNWAWVVYNMPQNGSVNVRVYNEAGELVLEVGEPKSAGVQETFMNLFYLRDGVFLCRVFLTPDGGVTQTLKTFKFTVVR